MDMQGNPGREPRTDPCREVQAAPLDYSNALDLSLNHALDLTAKAQVSLYGFVHFAANAYFTVVVTGKPMEKNGLIKRQVTL